MNGLFVLAAAATALAASPTAASEGAGDSEALVEASTQASGPAAVLQAYREALIARDASAMTPLFLEDSLVFENGKAEGSFAHYLAHHIGPELDAIESFTFSNPTLEVRMLGDVALGHETYGYRIALKDGRIIERDGIATSVLVEQDGEWKIARYHSSSRAPRK